MMLTVYLIICLDTQVSHKMAQQPQNIDYDTVILLS